jgi:hypothetical protein
MKEKTPSSGVFSFWVHSFRPSFAGNLSIRNMLMLLALAIPAIPSPTFAKQVELAWDANPASSKTAGYRVYYTQTRGRYNKQQVKDVGKTTRCVLDLSDGNWYLAVTAYDSNGRESGFSSEISWMGGTKTGSAARDIRKPVPADSSPPRRKAPDRASTGSTQPRKAPDHASTASTSASPLIPPSAHREYLPKSSPDDPQTLIPPSQTLH